MLGPVLARLTRRSERHLFRVLSAINPDHLPLLSVRIPVQPIIGFHSFTSELDVECLLDRG
jgi:hypothetical protein